MANLPIIRRTPEGGQKYLLSLTITHPVGDQPPQIDFSWDGEFVTANQLPLLFSQQVLNAALQSLFAAGLVICAQVVAPPTPPPGQN